ncbi:MAG: hypothetical protein CSB55_08400 [Candidatus Cloacimonadota bacterium]|nr:MAG: hypothetical protein CSB55_08400 [Candidatus Cloacimonadota bacterium]
MKKYVFRSDKPLRLDKYLAQLDIPELYSRSVVEKLIKNKKVTVNGKNEKKSFMLENGDEVIFEFPERKETELRPQKTNFDVILEDDYLAVINKPAGLIVHPGNGVKDGTLANGLLERFGDNLSYLNDPARPGIVHRLDKDTSGLLVIAKNDKVHALLSNMFRERKILKKYKAIILGVPDESEATIETFYGIHPKNRLKMAVLPTGRNAITLYKIEEYTDYFCLADIQIKTGRTHQIRVHMSHIHCPVLGDDLYSSLNEAINRVPSQTANKIKYLYADILKRQALHAYKLCFEHPITGKNLEAETGLPEDIDSAWKFLTEHYRYREER